MSKLTPGDFTSEPPEAAPTANVDHTLFIRQRVAVEQLEALAALIVAKLDELGIDADLEPVLGSLHGTAASGAFGNQERWAQGGTSDFEHQHDGREPDVDDEPSLGAPEGVQVYSFAGSLNELEMACEDEGAQCEDEGAVFDDEPDHDNEGDAQAACHSSSDLKAPWPPKFDPTRPYGGWS
jgi:hypothetical protein